MAAHCDVLESYASDPSAYDNAAHEASQILWALSGRQFNGLCGPITVRPCVRSCGCWVPGMMWSWDLRGYWLSGGGNGVSAVQDCGNGGGCCGSLSRVKLGGYPVREIEEVKINGDVIAAENYRLDSWKYLTYLDDPTTGAIQRWPACQNLALDDDQPGTFSVTYLSGVEPPQAGLDAAAELACQLAAFGVTGECDLPNGVVQIVRQGITIDMEKSARTWWTVLPLVASFLAAYNPNGNQRRAALYSPDISPFAQKVG